MKKNNKLYEITCEKEISDARLLAKKIGDDKWIDSSVVLVVCSPDYSSLSLQIINHKLSLFNGNEPFEQLQLEMPYPIMSQVWDRESFQYEKFERYLQKWINKYIITDVKYLFYDSATLRGKNFWNLHMMLRSKIERDNYKFASLYVEKNSVFMPDYYINIFDKEKDGGLIFEWENPNNPNWNY